MDVLPARLPRRRARRVPRASGRERQRRLRLDGRPRRQGAEARGPVRLRERARDPARRARGLLHRGQGRFKPGALGRDGLGARPPRLSGARAARPAGHRQGRELPPEPGALARRLGGQGRGGTRAGPVVARLVARRRPEPRRQEGPLRGGGGGRRPGLLHLRAGHRRIARGAPGRRLCPGVLARREVGARDPPRHFRSAARALSVGHGRDAHARRPGTQPSARGLFAGR